jgi:hypothetical protein
MFILFGCFYGIIVMRIIINAYNYLKYEENRAMSLYSLIGTKVI